MPGMFNDKLKNARNMKVNNVEFKLKKKWAGCQENLSCNILVFMKLKDVKTVKYKDQSFVKVTSHIKCNIIRNHYRVTII